MTSTSDDEQTTSERGGEGHGIDGNERTQWRRQLRGITTMTVTSAHDDGDDCVRRRSPL